MSNELIYVNPYVYQPNVLEWLKRTSDGQKYQMVQPIILDLGVPPTSGCANPFFVLSEAGQLYVLNRYTFNGPNVVPDSPWRMLAALAHDLLCEEDCKGQYSYYQKNLFYYKILCAQIGPTAKPLTRLYYKTDAIIEFAALLAGNWINDVRSKSTIRFHL